MKTILKIFVVLFILSIVFISGCLGGPAAMEISEGVTHFSGTMSETQDVTYEASDGNTYTTSAYPGYVYLYVKSGTDTETISKAIGSATIVSAFPAAGLYMLKITEGTESEFLSSLYDYSWFVDGAPAYPVGVGGEIIVYDEFSGAS